LIKNYWYLICPASEVKDQIITKTLQGQKIILFRGKDGKLVALEDRCCHRNVQLSLGYLREGRAVCAYHGWEYDNDGKCVLIPSQLPENKIPPTAKINSYPVQEFNRWVWVFIGDPEKADKVKPLDIPEMNQWDFTYKAYVFKADLESTAESLVDPYHIAFALRNSIRSFMGSEGVSEYLISWNRMILLSSGTGIGGENFRISSTRLSNCESVIVTGSNM